MSNEFKIDEKNSLSDFFQVEGGLISKLSPQDREAQHEARLENLHTELTLVAWRQTYQDVRRFLSFGLAR